MLSKDIDALVPKGVRFLIRRDGLDEENWWNGRFLVWETPERGATYAIGVDCSEGVGADRSVASVIKLGTGKTPDTQVAEFASDWHGAAAMAPIVSAIGRFYSDDEGLEAIVTAEANMIGQVFLQDLRLIHGYTNLYIRRSYDRVESVWIDKLGFVTNKQTRLALLTRGLHGMQMGHLKPKSEYLLQEMEDFESDWNLALARAKSGQHDDRVIAFFLAYWGVHDEQWAVGEDPVEDFQRLTAAGKVAEAQEQATGRKRSGQNTAISAEDLTAQWDEEIFG